MAQISKFFIIAITDENGETLSYVQDYFSTKHPPAETLSPASADMYYHYMTAEMRADLIKKYNPDMFLKILKIKHKTVYHVQLNGIAYRSN